MYQGAWRKNRTFFASICEDHVHMISSAVDPQTTKISPGSPEMHAATVIMMSQPAALYFEAPKRDYRQSSAGPHRSLRGSLHCFAGQSNGSCAHRALEVSKTVGHDAAGRAPLKPLRILMQPTHTQRKTSCGSLSR